MRFRLSLELKREKYGNTIPINYQYELSAVIYKILSRADSRYSEWLHDNGFILDSKRFKLFNYSRLYIPVYKLDREAERLVIRSDKVFWQISFLPDKSTENFIEGVFKNQTFELGDKKSRVSFNIVNIEVTSLPDDLSKGLFLKTLSPICISKMREDGKTEYLPPDQIEAPQFLLRSLINRYEALYNKPYTGSTEFEYKILSPPKSVLTKIKADTPQETKVKAFMCRLYIKADEELIKVLFNSGLGQKNSLGFGFMDVVPEKTKTT